MHFTKVITLILTCYFIASDSYAEPITISYLDRPPYYFNDNQKASGILVEQVKSIISAADLEAKYILRPPKRIIRELKTSKAPYCSIGWFKTKEREAFAKFSKMIYQNKPIVALILKTESTKLSAINFAKHDSLEDLFKDKELKFGHISDFSYGLDIDNLIMQHSPNAYSISGQQKQLVKMLALERISYMLVAPEEIEMLIESASLLPANFQTLELNDIPRGNKRYLMCNKGISKDTMDRINRAITKTIALQKQ